jgi:hypothetical protein
MHSSVGRGRHRGKHAGSRKSLGARAGIALRQRSESATWLGGQAGRPAPVSGATEQRLESVVFRRSRTTCMPARRRARALLARRMPASRVRPPGVEGGSIPPLATITSRSYVGGRALTGHKAPLLRPCKSAMDDISTWVDWNLDTQIVDSHRLCTLIGPRPYGAMRFAFTRAPLIDPVIEAIAFTSTSFHAKLRWPTFFPF